MMRIPLWLKKTLMRFGFKFTAACGHRSHRKISGVVNGHKVTALVKVEEDGQIPICNKCFVKLSIPCAWCGLPIVLGDPVTLKTAKDGHIPPDGHVKHGDLLVGCLRDTCSSSELETNGYWMPKEDLKAADVYVVINPFMVFKALFESGNIKLTNELRIPETDIERLLGEIPSSNNY
jgi:hypothetical protein